MSNTMELTKARPYPYRFRPESTALLVIDMQRDFLDPNGFGAIQCGNDVIFQTVRQIVPQTKLLLQRCRELGLHVLHTREGHKPDLSDLPPAKKLRQTSAPSGHHTLGIGDEGPMGRLLVQGEYGHDIIDELRPLPGEVVIDKPGKGSFWSTTLHRALLARGITHLMIVGVTTDCCVNTTFREAADRGFECCVLNDCTAGYETAFFAPTLDNLCFADGLFGYVSSAEELLKQRPASLPSPPSTPPGFDGDLSIASLRKQYSTGRATPTEVAKYALARIADYQSKDPAVWTFLESPQKVLSAAAALEERYRNQPPPPLYGLMFGVKDTLDITGIPTTAACEAYTYTPIQTAPTVQAMLDAGALFVGKTNLDQLATGLSGCRSPFGSPHSVYDRSRISGGSSSGSAVAVGAGLVSFTLGTDTAGSGRVPAMFNGVVSFKPTKGTLSARGLVPACKSLDTVTVLAQTVEDARAVWLVADQGPDMSDPYNKPLHTLPLWHVDFRGPKAGGFKFGVPPATALQACNPGFRSLFYQAVERMKRAGGVAQEVDWTPYKGGNDLLYEGALLNERIDCLGPDFLRSNAETLHPTIRRLFDKAMSSTIQPWEVFRDLHLQARYTRAAALGFNDIDVLVVPTTTCHPTVAEMEADPLALNSRLGEYTHFANVLDLCGMAVPASLYDAGDGKKLPFGVTLLGASGTDGKVFDIAREFERTR